MPADRSTSQSTRVPNNYPVPPPEPDKRFTVGLVQDVAKALQAHGFPALSSGEDYVRLREHLFQFIYAEVVYGEVSDGE